MFGADRCGGFHAIAVFGLRIPQRDAQGVAAERVRVERPRDHGSAESADIIRSRALLTEPTDEERVAHEWPFGFVVLFDCDGVLGRFPPGGGDGRRESSGSTVFGDLSAAFVPDIVACCAMPVVLGQRREDSQMSQAPPAAPPGFWQASDGKWYPPQGNQPPPPGYAPPQAPQKKGHGCLYAFLGALGLGVVIVVVIIIAAASAVKKVSNNVTNGNPGGPAPAAAYKVGDTAKTSNDQVTVYGVKDPQAPVNQFSTPSPGNHFVSVDVQVTNTQTDQQAFSSLFAFHLLDSQNRQYGETLAGFSPSAPEGQIASGQSIRGFVVFEVPDGTTGLKLRVQGSLTAAGAVFALS
jgi:hypothetical protein